MDMKQPRVGGLIKKHYGYYPSSPSPTAGLSYTERTTKALQAMAAALRGGLDFAGRGF